MHRLVTMVVVVVLAVAGSTPADAQPGMQDPIVPSLHKGGLLHTGFSVELLDVGAIQAHTRYGTARGVDLGIGFQYQLGLHWAIRVPIELGGGGFGQGAGYAEAAIIPGALYRFRERADQLWVPYVGAGTKLGTAGIGRALVGRPLAIACCHDWDGGDGGSSSDPNTENTSVNDGAPSLELWAGYEWNRTSWFALQFDLAVGYERLLDTNVFVIRETVGARFTL